jgi:hypothetical protein
MTAMLLLGIAIAVLLYIVVQRLDRIIALQLQHQEHLGRIVGLLKLPHQQAEREKANPLLEKAIADFGSALKNADPERVAEMGRELRERGLV